jgi:hypothetical protein
MSPDRSILAVVGDLLNETTALFRDEVRLARTEISEKVSAAKTSLALVGLGAALLIPALVVLLEAGAAALAERGYSPAVSSFAVGGLVFVLAAIVLLIGISRLKGESLAPKKAVHQLQRDAELARQQVMT